MAMASSARFFKYPAFGEDIPSALSPRISLKKLAANDVDECSALFASCRSLGFFLLDLSSDQTGEALVQDIDNLLDLA